MKYPFASAYSPLLDLPSAKQLLADIRKSGKRGSWVESSVDGTKMWVDLPPMTCGELSELDLPESCLSFWMDSPNRRLESSEFLPTSIFPNDWFPPYSGDVTSMTVTCYVDELKFPLSVQIIKSTDNSNETSKYSPRRIIQLSLGECHIPDFQDDLHSSRPTNDIFREFVLKLLKTHEIPYENSKDVLGYDEYSTGAIRLTVRANEEYLIGEHIQQLLETLVKNSPVNHYIISEMIRVGIYTSLVDLPWIIKLDADHVIRMIAESKILGESKFEVSYSKLSKESWSSFEKRRKKSKSELRSELGRLTLDNGSVVEVNLSADAEGYVFGIGFQTEEDLYGFGETKCFGLTGWTSDRS